MSCSCVCFGNAEWPSYGKFLLYSTTSIMFAPVCVFIGISAASLLQNPVTISALNDHFRALENVTWRILSLHSWHRMHNFYFMSWGRFWKIGVIAFTCHSTWCCWWFKGYFRWCHQFWLYWHQWSCCYHLNHWLLQSWHQSVLIQSTKFLLLLAQGYRIPYSFLG